VRAGNYGEMLLEVARRLCEELSGPPAPTAPNGEGPLPPPSSFGISHGLDAEDRKVVESLRSALSEIALALCPTSGEASPESAVAALDGIESVVAAELLRGNPEQLPKLMPSFVFLVALQVGGQDRALELCIRAAELIDEIAY
jgi:hypothetical protein